MFRRSSRAIGYIEPCPPVQQLGVMHATACCGVIIAAAVPDATKAKTTNAMIFFMVFYHGSAIAADAGSAYVGGAKTYLNWGWVL
jgi:hypothetical protein